MDGVEIIEPPQYSVAWSILALLCLLAIIGTLLAIRLVTRWAAERAAWAKRPTESDTVKAEFLRVLADLRRRFDAGEIGTREAHQELVALLRLFVRRTSGIAIDTEHLDAVRRDPELGRMGELIGRLYEPSFSLASSAQMDESLQEAREVIRAW